MWMKMFTFKYVLNKQKSIPKSSVITVLYFTSLSLNPSDEKKVKKYILPSSLVEGMSLNVHETDVIANTLNLSMLLMHKAGIIGKYTILMF